MRLKLIAAIVLSLLCESNRAFAQARFVPFGLPSAGSAGGHPRAISADGTIVVGAVAGSPTNTGAFRWTESTGYQFPPGLPGLFGGDAYDISANGSKIAGWLTNGSPVAVRWDANGARSLGDLPGGLQRSIAVGISGDGNIVVGLGESTIGEQAFRWTEASGMVALPGLPNEPGRAAAIDVSDSGNMIVGKAYRTRAQTKAVAWNEQGSIIDLPGSDPDSAWSVATNVSADGSVIVGNNGSRTHGQVPFRWTAETGLVSLVSPISDQYFTSGVSADGRFIVGQMLRREINSDVAFIWDEDHGIRNLQQMLEEEYGLTLPGWILYRAADISDDGLVITGSAYNPRGIPEPYILYLPEPSTPAALLSALVLIRMRRRAR